MPDWGQLVFLPYVNQEAFRFGSVDLRILAVVVVIWGVLTHPPQIIQKTTQKIPKIFQNRRGE
eukprot:SAG11_NODE_20963_length_434_cov_3.820896_1_plen_62_part_10